MDSSQPKVKGRSFLRRAKGRLWQALGTIGATLAESYRRFIQGRHILYAAAVSFYGLLSLVPLLALALSLSGRLLRSPEASLALGRALGRLLPAPMETFVSAARAISTTSLRAELLYLFGLIWAGAYLFESLERVVNVACDGQFDRAYHVRKLIGMTAVVAAGLLLLTSIALGAAWATIGHFLQLPASEWPTFGRLIKKAGILLPLLTSVLVFSLMYKFLPIKRVRWKAALAGGLFSGLSWEISKWAFGLFVVYSGQEYGTLYGSLANVVIIMLWIHVSAIILIMGAHIGCITQQRLEGSAPLRRGSCELTGENSEFRVQSSETKAR